MTEYLAVISLLAAALTVYDKLAAKTLPGRRIPERVLMGTALLGGAAAEYITMKLIRHKTRHKKFMTGLPLITALHVIIILSIIYLNR